MNNFLKFSSGEGIFFTSDTHFWHSNIIKFCNRPYATVEEMNEDLINKWNAKVGQDDIVFHLGDFCFAGDNKWNDLLHRLHGTIYLIRGNHENKNLSESIAAKFKLVTMQMEITIENRNIYLNHYPLLCYGGVYRKPEQVVWALSGHTHICKQNNAGKDFNRMQYMFPTQYDVGVDFNDFSPISFAEVKEKIDYQVANNVNLMHWVK